MKSLISKVSLSFIAVLVAVLMVATVDRSLGQEKSTEPKVDSKAEKDENKKDESQADSSKNYADLLSDWKTKEEKLKDLEAQYIVSGQAKKNEIRTEYNKLLDEIKPLIPELRSKAIAAYQKNPNEDESLIRLLIGMLTNDLHKNRFDEFFELGDILIAGKCDIKHFKAIHNSKRLVSFGIEYPIDELIARHGDALKNESADNKLPRAIVKTSDGDIEIELFEDAAPNHVANFISLASKGFYKESEWHRVSKAENVVQGGQSKDGKEIGYTLEGEWNNPNRRRHFKGHVGAARLPDPNSASSQFYIVTDRVPGFDIPGNSYTVFGRVISGMEHVHNIQQGHKMIDVEIIRKRNHEYVPKPYKPGEAENDPSKESDKKAAVSPEKKDDAKTDKSNDKDGKQPEKKEESKAESKGEKK